MINNINRKDLDTLKKRTPLFVGTGIFLGALVAGAGFATYIHYNTSTDVTMSNNEHATNTNDGNGDNKKNVSNKNESKSNTLQNPFKNKNQSTIKQSTNDSKSDTQTNSVDKVNFVGNDGNVVTLDLIGLKATYGTDIQPKPTVSPSHTIPDIHFTIPENQVGQLSAYWVNEGDQGKGVLLLAPKGWIGSDVSMGADGSIKVHLQSPIDPNQALDFMGDGACQGCAAANIAAYFPKQIGMVKRYLSPGETIYGADIKNRYYISNQTVGYTKSDPNGMDVNGTAHWTNNDDTLTFHNESIALPRENHALETTILNFFIASVGKAY
jgi:hypothetical protein